MIKADRGKNKITHSPKNVPVSENVIHPEYALISEILRIVPASRWAFGQLETRGKANSRTFTSFMSSHHCNDEREFLADELQRQRICFSTGPRIAATLGALHGYDCGVTLLIADEQTDFAILTLYRSAELGSFTSGDIRMLALALGALLEHLETLRLRPLFRETPMDGLADELASSTGAFYLLNRDFEIVLTECLDKKSHVTLNSEAVSGIDRLPSVIEESVRRLTAARACDQEQQPGVAYPVPFMAVRAQPMTGVIGFFIGVHIHRLAPRNSLSSVALQYHISPREVQTLALLLDGNQLEEIAMQLHITSSTVQDHINSMIDKTCSRNRSELIARIFGWYSPLNAS